MNSKSDCSCCSWAVKTFSLLKQLRCSILTKRYHSVENLLFPHSHDSCTNTFWITKHILIERFPIACRKTKTKVNTLAATDVNNATSQPEFEANTSTWRQARENACGQNTIGFGLDSHWLRKWRKFCEPITERKTKPKQTRNYFRHLIKNRSIWNTNYSENP